MSDETKVIEQPSGMVRFLLEHRETREELGGTCTGHFTVDACVPELAYQLRRGGRGDMGSEFVQLLGVEVLSQFPTTDPPPALQPTISAREEEAIYSAINALRGAGRHGDSGTLASLAARLTGGGK